MEAIYLKPEILTHPNIPKPLHGLNPRNIMGQEWWDKERQAVYARNNFRCAACGVHKSQAKKYKWLEAHEFYEIDYKKGLVEIKSIEPLCHYCHNFIHSGRLKSILGKEKTMGEVKDILKHGFLILSRNGLKCFYSTLKFAEEIGCETFGVEAYSIINSNIAWGDWKLIFDGKEFVSGFKNYDDWQNFY